MDFNAARNIPPIKWLKLGSTTGSGQGFTLLSRGYWNSALKLPISQERMVCLDLHGIYSPWKYEALCKSPQFLEELRTGLPLLRNGIMFLGESNYWHFLIDGVSRLEKTPIAENPTFYIDESLTAFQEAFISTIVHMTSGGQPEIKRIRPGNYSLQNIFVPWTNGDRVKDTRILIEKYCANYKIPGGKGKIIYVTRSKAGMRRLLNEDEVIALLKKKYDLEVVDCSSVTIETQVSLFRGARAVIGPHGAGLTNAIFMQSPGLILELFHSVRQGFFEALARSLNCSYRAVEGTRKTDSDPLRMDNGDFVVEPGLVLKAMEGFTC